MRAPWLCLLGLAACGGGGGGGTAPAGNPTRLTVAGADLPTTATSTELVVRLAETPGTGPVLLEVLVTLPNGLVPTADALVAIQPVPTLDGNLVDGRYRVLCGDARNPTAAPLLKGDLFRLRLQASTPRLTGSLPVSLQVVRAATSDGSAATVDPNPTLTTVTVR